MQAFLVHESGSPTISIPPPMGTPRSDQLKGTVAEQLVELAGRVCYDSLGVGRSSAAYHPHILESKHGSVLEHFHFTVEVGGLSGLALLGVPDVVVTRCWRHHATTWLRATFNLRHVVEGLEKTATFPLDAEVGEYSVRNALTDWNLALRREAHQLCPQIVPEPPTDAKFTPGWAVHHQLVAPERDSECFVSLWLEESLVWSHEQVRHRFNMSQRSGRFVDQTDRPMCIHPLLEEYLNEVGHLKGDLEDLTAAPEPVVGEGAKGQPVAAVWVGGDVDSQEAKRRTQLGSYIGQNNAQQALVYTAVVEHLQPWLERKGLDKLAARKQARSAARYYLGQGLSTEMIFTASIRSWRDIFAQRCSPAADQAIRNLMDQAQALVKSSRHGHLL